MVLPAHAFKNFLTEAVAIARIFSGAICFTVAFNGEQVILGIGLFESDIDATGGAADVCLDVITVILQKRPNFAFELGIGTLSVR